MVVDDAHEFATLQWGRDFNVAERSVRPAISLENTHASMGPRL